MADIQTLKKQMRLAGVAARESLSLPERQTRSGKACRAVVESEAFVRAKNIFVYRGVKAEIDPTEIVTSALRMGKTVAYPVCGKCGVMQAMVPETDSDMKRGAFGIWEPDPARSRILDPNEVDIAIVPCTCFDGGARRVGMGGGYYDRYLPKCSSAVKILFAYEIQRVDSVPADAFDYACDFIATENGMFAAE